MTTALVGEAGPELVIPMAMTAAGTAEAESATDVTVEPSGRWEGVLGVMDQWSADKRMLRAPEGPVRTRPLPLPLLVQPELAPGHDRAKLGIAQIERVWSDGDRVMGSGTIDMEDPLGQDLARKIAAGFVRFVSLDVDDSTELQVCLDAEDNIIQDCDPASGESAGYGQVYSGWRVMGATLLAHPAFPDAHITMAGDGPSAPEDAASQVPVEGEMAAQGVALQEEGGQRCVVRHESSPTGWLVAPCDLPDAVPANEDGTGPAEEADEVPLPTADVPSGEDAPDAGNGGDDVIGDEVGEPEETEEAPDLGGGCVVPDEGADTGWRQAPCDAEGAVPANEDGTGPADEVTEAASDGEQETMAVRWAVDTDLPWAERDHEWDGDAARQRVAAWATSGEELDPERMTRAFLVVEGPPENVGSYRFGVADVIDGQLRLVWRGVVAANAALHGARTPTTLSPDQQRAALNRVKVLYNKAAEHFEDDSIADAARELAAAAQALLQVQQPPEPPAPEQASAARAAAPEQPGGECLPCGEAQVADALVAGAGEAPGFTPPREWFDDPQFSEPTPITVDTDTGQIRGHLASWGTCHVGFTDRCITPPRSRSHYAYFHTATVPTTDGQVDVGVVTMDTGHAALNLSASNASAHYDNTGTQCAVVRVGEDAHGIWMAGACLPFIDADQRLRLSLARFSGDWRAVRGGAELVAALAVNSPGFPVPQRRRGQDNRDYALVAAGVMPAARPEPQAPGAGVQVLTAHDVEAAIQRAVQEAFEQQAIAQRKDALAQEEREARLAVERQERAELEQRMAAAAGRLGALRQAERDRRVATASGVLNRLRVQALADRVDRAIFGTGKETGDLPPVIGLPKPSRGDLEFARGFRNWVSQQGGLPRKIKSVARHLKRKGMPESRAIATAVNVAKKACRSGDTNWPGVQQINSKSRAEFCAAVAQWERMKAAAKARR